uniref:Type I inositol 1,4,5-trisphosphate 5-phosphatase CVP2 n=1 Tax=Anthurium amnicola TaxID=1678845 RepID=A0A1D1Y9G1_9ARAE
MRDESTKKSKLSWSKSLVRKWFNIKNKAQNFHVTDDATAGGGDGEWMPSFSEKETSTVQKSRTDLESEKHSDTDQVTDTLDYRIFVSTWNVGGKSPPSHLNLEGWLQTSPPVDIYVLGFQEIVPLNAGNVLGSEDNGPAKKWVALIRNTLNNLPGTSRNGSFRAPSPVPDPIAVFEADFEGSSSGRKASTLFHRHSFQSLGHSLRIDSDIMVPQSNLGHRFSVCDRVLFGSRPSDYDPNYKWGVSSDDENVGGDSPGTIVYSPMSCRYSISSYMEEKERLEGHSRHEPRYCLVASKQMVGIFLTVWVRSGIKDDIRNMKISCVGRGLMGYLGNKGSISISMLLHQTSFCFICSHLTSGQKEGDELRRNSDVMEILRKTRFPRVHGLRGKRSPETILEHEYACHIPSSHSHCFGIIFL